MLVFHILTWLAHQQWLSQWCEFGGGAMSLSDQWQGESMLAKPFILFDVTSGNIHFSCKYCHESTLWTSIHSPPEVTRSSHGLLHYTNRCTSHSLDYSSHHPLHIHSWMHWLHSWFPSDMLHKPWTSSFSLPSIVYIYHSPTGASLVCPVIVSSLV